MSITTTSSLGDTLPTIIEEARHTENFLEVASKLVWVINKKLHSGLTTNLPYWGTATATGLTEGVDMSNPQTMVDTNVPITPAEVGAQILITDKVVRDNQEDVIRAAGVILGNSMVVKRENDLLTLIASATTTLGGASTTLTLGIIAASQALLSGNAIASGGPAPKPYVFIHHPFALLDIVDVFTPLGAVAGTPLAAAGAAGSLADDYLRNYWVGRIFGMNVYESGNFTIASTGVKGGVFASGRGGGLVLVTAKEWDIKPDPDPSLRATELNIVGEYGVAVYLAGWIVGTHADVTTPA